MKIDVKGKNLYHGSIRAGIKVLTLFPHNAVDGESVVFATSDKRFALAMIHGTGNELAVGYFVDQQTHKEEMYIDELQEGKLSLLNAPGVLYEVAGDNFISDPRLSHVEFVSKIETPVINEVYVENILEELKKDTSLTIVLYEEVLEAMKKRGKNPAEPTIKYGANRFEQRLIRETKDEVNNSLVK